MPSRAGPLSRGAIKREFLWFCIAGTIGFGVDVTALLALVEGLGWDVYLARVPSFGAAATATWLVNRGVTFARRRAGGPGGSVFAEWARYLLAMTLGGLLNFGAYAAIVAAFGARPAVLVAGVVVGTALGLTFNFLSSRHWVFAPADER